MRLLCPHCTQAITIADSEAGKEIDCPLCKQRFAAPQLFAPPAPYAVAPAPVVEPKPAVAMPPVVPEVAQTSPAPESTAAPKPPATPGSRRSCWLTVCPNVLAWIAPAALLVAFILSFFSWAGMYPAGYSAYTQNAWLALFASVSADPVAEDELKLLTDIKDRLRTSWWLLPYLPLLLLGVAAAWAGVIASRLKLKLPSVVQSFWQYRSAAIGVLSVLMLFFVMAQWSAGIGLQRAIHDRIEAEHATAKAEANTPEKMQRWEMKVAMQQGAYQVRTTIWLRLVVLSHAIAAIAIVLEAWMLLRGDRSPPRIGLEW